ncbi:MAG: hypothetical protein NZ902_06550 [Acidilobaceae archaeon]|nr:hypothetical protein [Acidilobaceae archaeon]
MPIVPGPIVPPPLGTTQTTAPPPPPGPGPMDIFSRFGEYLKRVGPDFWAELYRPRPFPWSFGDILAAIGRALAEGRRTAEEELRAEWLQALQYANTMPEEVREEYLNKVRESLTQKASALGVRLPITAAPTFKTDSMPLSEVASNTLDSIRKALQARGASQEQVEAILNIVGSTPVPVFRTADGRVIPRMSEVNRILEPYLGAIARGAIDDIGKVDVTLPDGRTVRLSPDEAARFTISKLELDHRINTDRKRLELEEKDYELRKAEVEFRREQTRLQNYTSIVGVALKMAEAGVDPSAIIRDMMQKFGIQEGEYSPVFIRALSDFAASARNTIRNEQRLKEIQLRIEETKLNHLRSSLPLEIKKLEADIAESRARIEEVRARIAEARERGALTRAQVRAQVAALMSEVNERETALRARRELSEILQKTPPEDLPRLLRDPNFVSRAITAFGKGAFDLIPSETIDTNLVAGVAQTYTERLKRAHEYLLSGDRRAAKRAVGSVLEVFTEASSLLVKGGGNIDINGRFVLTNVLSTAISSLRTGTRYMDDRDKREVVHSLKMYVQNLRRYFQSVGDSRAVAELDTILRSFDTAANNNPEGVLSLLEGFLQRRSR